MKFDIGSLMGFVLNRLLRSIQWRLRWGVFLVATWPRDQIMLLKLPFITQHIYGPQQVSYALDELIVLCVVRNGEYYIKSFIEHYLKLGVKHIVFLDNGSTDETISIAQLYPKVTVLQTECLYAKYENAMKIYLVKRFSKNRWNLFADIDELFDYPGSDVMNLSSLLTYLNQNSYTSVVTQMLDLFSAYPLNQIKSSKEDSIRDIYTYYDITNIRKAKYNHGKQSNPNVMKYHDGIRKSIFGTENGLSKASLTFIDHRIQLFIMGHHTRNSLVADFTCVLLHYPFLSTFYEKVADAVRYDRYKLSASDQYQKYLEGLQQNPNLTLKTATACQLKNINDLLDSDFLVASEKYLQWVNEHTNLNIESPLETSSSLTRTDEKCLSTRPNRSVV